MSSTINKYQLEKLGNTLVYLANNVGEFQKTKALKLLFLLEENSIKKYGIPFFGFDFKVWQFGPVNEQVYESLNSDDLTMVNSFIRRVNNFPDEFEASAEFNDDEFSQNDMELLDEVVRFARHKTAKDLVRITHGKDSLWRKKAKEEGIYEKLEKSQITKTDILIDFSKLLDGDEYLKERYTGALEHIDFTTQINA